MVDTDGSRTIIDAIKLTQDEVATYLPIDAPEEAKLFGMSLLARFETEQIEGDPLTLDLWLAELASHEHLTDYVKTIKMVWSHLMRHAAGLPFGDIEELLDRRDRLIALASATSRENVAATRFATVEAMRVLLDSYAPSYVEDVDRVSRTCVSIGRELGMRADELELLRASAQVRDIGMVMIPRHIVDSSAPLSADDLSMIQRHVDFSVDILRSVHSLRDCIPIVAAHHERYDGAGYPSRLSRKQIPTGARILALSNAVQAMLSPRPYRAARTPREVQAILAQESGAQWDPSMTEIAIELIDSSELVLPKPLLSLAPVA